MSRVWHLADTRAGLTRRPLLASKQKWAVINKTTRVLRRNDIMKQVNQGLHPKSYPSRAVTPGDTYIEPCSGRAASIRSGFYDFFLV